MPVLTRREFVSIAGAAAFTAAGYTRVLGANERLRVGVIGCGGMAGSHMRALLAMKESDNVEIAAVCDVYEKRLQEAAQLTGGEQYRDYRRLLESKAIDYVLIATPEHWHARMTLDAADAAKHIYCEKPMTYTVEEGRRVVQKIQGSKVKVQVGVQGMSDDSYEAANRLVKAGVLGKVVQAQIDYSRNYKDDFWFQEHDPDVRPGVNLDWKAFLGPARKRAFEPDRFFNWRRYWDYSGGIASDLFVHRVTRIIRSLDLEFPERGVGTGGRYLFVESKGEIPDTFNISLEYPGGPNVLLVSSMANDTPIEHVLRGHKATLKFTREGFELAPQRLYKDEVEPQTHTKTGGEDVTLHHRNLMAAIRSNEPLKCDVMLGYKGVVACQMGIQSYRRRKYLAWDRAGQRLVNA